MLQCIRILTHAPIDTYAAMAMLVHVTHTHSAVKPLRLRLQIGCATMQQLAPVVYVFDVNALYCATQAVQFDCTQT